jgi:hypothetical protein
MVSAILAIIGKIAEKREEGEQNAMEILIAITGA